MDIKVKYIEVILPLAFSGQTFTYLCADKQPPPKVGMRVSVPFMNGMKIGVVAEVHGQDSDLKNVRMMGEVMDTEPIFTQGQVDMMRWVAEYYMCPVGQVLRAYQPEGIRSGSYEPPTLKAYQLVATAELEQLYESLKKRKAATVTIDVYMGFQDPENEKYLPVSRKELLAGGASPVGIKYLVENNIFQEVEVERRRYSQAGRFAGEDWGAQSELMSKIKSAAKPILLYNRGDGELYQILKELIRSNSAEGKMALILAPDSYSAGIIAERFETGFEVVEYHAKQSIAARNASYYRILRHPQSVDLIIGTRTATMLPFSQLGLVIVLEESDFGHKSTDRSPLINGRDIAMMLAAKSHATTILTTKAPSMEAYAMCKYGRWAKIDVGREWGEAKVKLLEKGKNIIFSKYMLQRVEETLENGDQVVVLQNRRGFASSVFCTDCGYTPSCERCNVTLTLHRSTQTLQCHYCGFTIPAPKVCAKCGSPNLTMQGLGTERVVEQLQELFTNATIARVDSDSVARSDIFGELSQDDSDAQADIIVGTQLILRGLRPPKVKLAVVINADNMFVSTDFRTSERALVSLLRLRSMVGNGGELIIQSWNISNPVLKAMEWNEVSRYYEQELAERHALNYPPIVRLILIKLYAKGRGRLIEAASELDRRLTAIFGSRVSPPYEPVIDKIEDRYILEIMLRLERNPSLEKAKKALEKELISFRKDFANVEVHPDVDPV